MLVTDDSQTGVGAQIAARRIALGMTVKGLAELAGIHRDTISAIEAGKGQTPRPATVGAIMRALDRFEEEVGVDMPDGVRLVGDPDEGLIELTFEGGFGRIVVKGPAGNLAEMRETVVALIRAGTDLEPQRGQSGEQLSLGGQAILGDGADLRVHGRVDLRAPPRSTGVDPRQSRPGSPTYARYTL